jgi:hypothetical protein
VIPLATPSIIKQVSHRDWTRRLDDIVTGCKTGQMMEKFQHLDVVTSYLHADASLFTISLIFPLALGLRVVPVV